MKFEDLSDKGIPRVLIDKFKEKNITLLNSAQKKAVKQGLLEYKNLLVCTPTGSGKTAIATLAITKSLVEHKGKAVYLVPLKALANEKYKDYKQLFEGTNIKVGISTGDPESKDSWLSECDLLLLTVEKMDSLIRHHAPWLKDVKVVVIDEVHLLNDPGRGPTLEVLIIILKEILKNIQLIALSATIGNPEELAEWLNAELVIDSWRPVELHKGIYLDGEVKFY